MRWIAVVCLAWSVVLPLGAQTGGRVFAGRVVDAADDQPLPGANVFVAGSTMGTATDAEGFFRLALGLSGPVDLVVSMVGYERQQVRLDASRSGLVFRLVASPVALGGVEVTAQQDKAWRRHLKRFTALFLGATRNASRCTILNPEVLDFTYDPATDFLTARSDAPLVFENRALGYRVEYLLDRFVGSETTLQWGGVSHFTEMMPRDERERKRFEAERRRAFMGSPRHFLAALQADSLYEAQFRVYATPTPGSVHEDRPIEPEAWHTLLKPTGEAGRSYLDFSQALMVSFMGEPEEDSYRQGRRLSHPSAWQLSWLKLRAGPVAVDATGHVLDAYDLVQYGYWAWEGAAELLPWDYRPETLIP